MVSKRTVAYVTTTAVLSVALVVAGALDVTRAPQIVETLAKLGYPAYLASILGVGKLLGVAAIVAPRWPRLKEWAYAGIVFDLKGAIASHFFAGDPTGATAPALLLALAAASWALRPDDRRLPAPAEQ
jgi:uncharacterized membrane protein YphA (DoxX/SURF4 family)